MFIILSDNNLGHHRVIWGSFKSVYEGLEVSSCIEGLTLIWIEISNFADLLFALWVASCINKTSVASRVLDNLNGHQVGFELEQVLHHSGGDICQLFTAEIVEFVKPDLFNSELNLLERIVLHCFRNELCVDLDIFVRCGSRGYLIQEFAEIISYW